MPTDLDLIGTLCPCGAEPRPGSAYCSDDCTPVPGAGVPLSHDYPVTARRRSVVAPEVSTAVPRVDDGVSVVWTAGQTATRKEVRRGA